MNQPKFKFGDKVKAICEDVKFEIDSIERMKRIYDGRNTYFYSGFNINEVASRSTQISEEALGFYQEPHKKKLYAYRHLGEQVIFSTSDRIHSPKDSIFRATEYDLDYPEK